MMTPIEQAAYEKWLKEGCQRFGFQMMCMIAKQGNQILCAASGSNPVYAADAQRLQKHLNDNLIANGGVNQTRHFERN